MKLDSSRGRPLFASLFLLLTLSTASNGQQGDRKHIQKFASKDLWFPHLKFWKHTFEGTYFPPLRTLGKKWSLCCVTSPRAKILKDFATSSSQKNVSVSATSQIFQDFCLNPAQSERGQEVKFTQPSLGLLSQVCDTTPSFLPKSACNGLRATGNLCSFGDDLLSSPHCCDHYLTCANGIEYEMPCAALSDAERLWFDAKLGVCMDLFKL